MLITCILVSTILIAGCSSSKMAARAQRPLYEKTWMLGYINGKKVEPTDGKTPQLQFLKAERKVTGNTGCNSMNGSFSVSDEGGLKFGALATTKMACVGPNLENVFTAVINRTNRFAVSNTTLLLYDNESLLAIFSAQ